MRRKNSRVLTTVLLFQFLAASSSVVSGPPAEILGQVVSQTASIDGTDVTSGTTLFDQNQVKTGQAAAFIHLKEGAVLELSRESSASFRKRETGMLEVTVHSGSLYFREPEREMIAISGALSQQTAQAPPAEPGQGIVARLRESAGEGQKDLLVDDTSAVSPTAPVLIESPDESRREIHYIDELNGDRIRLTAALQSSFPAQSTITQGSELGAAIRAGVMVVGAVKGTGGGVSTGVVVGIIAAAGGAGAVVAATRSGGDGGGEPPATQVNP
jgi:hypothetical protein